MLMFVATDIPFHILLAFKAAPFWKII